MTTIANRWELGHRLGEGGFGNVRRARDLTGGPDVAIKQLTAHDPDVAARMRRTAQQLAAIEHPGIVRVIEVAHWERLGELQPALVMELVRGGRTLEHLIAQSAPLAPASALEQVERIVDALAVAHDAGLVHRDIKPANLLDDPDSGLPILIDFDLAKVDGANVTVVHTLIGTPPYAAPELLDARSATPASDLYSVGVILRELLTGAPDGQLPAGVPIELRSLVEHLTKPDAARRPQRASDVRDAIRELL